MTEDKHLEENPPKDRLNLVYITLMLHGIGTLMPWNMFINAKDYFTKYKLSEEYTGVESDYVTNFLSYLGVASNGPALLFAWLNVFIQLGGDITPRIVWSLVIEGVVFVATIVLVTINSSQWPGIFFWLTMVSIVIINMANGIYQNTVYGMAAKLPFKYTGATIIGTNVCGTLTSLASITSLAIAPDAKTAGLYYFSTALLIIVLCLVTYFALPLNKFYRHYGMLNQEEELLKRKENDVNNQHVRFIEVFRQCFPQCFNVFFIFFVSLTIFPTVQSDIQRTDSEFFINEKYYSQIMCFLTFNLSACIGSSLSVFGSWPSPRWVVLPVVLRVLFIPLFLVLNYQPSFTGDEVRVLPILITNDWVYWCIGVVFALTSGYFSSVCMMYCSSTVDQKYSSMAAMMGAASLVMGIFCGVSLSSVMSWLVANVS